MLSYVFHFEYSFFLDGDRRGGSMPRAYGIGPVNSAPGYELLPNTSRGCTSPADRTFPQESHILFQGTRLFRFLAHWLILPFWLPFEKSSYFARLNSECAMASSMPSKLSARI